jgi:hypothetical protein
MQNVFHQHSSKLSEMIVALMLLFPEMFRHVLIMVLCRQGKKGKCSKDKHPDGRKLSQPFTIFT